MNQVDVFWFARKSRLFQSTISTLNVPFYKCKQELTSTQAILQLRLNLRTYFP